LPEFKCLQCLFICYFQIVPHIYTRAELASINSEPNAKKLIVVDNKVYDITEFIQDHPGGENVILTQVGRDASGKRIK
jgi:cytochrome b involved in lipid metabolism